MPPRQTSDWGLLSSFGFPDFMLIGRLHLDTADIPHAEDLLAKYETEVQYEEDDDLKHVHERNIKQSVLLHFLLLDDPNNV